MKLNVPVTVAVGAGAAGIGLFIAGVFVLAGTGWAMLAGAAPLLSLSAVTFRGLMRVAE
ncbi:hypothetical protein [Cupriavidus pauculus]|uniref:hypothetical protein n=1 Tax=Cupriavidus pauculus TaxID=82633 RepID=UPI000AEF0CA2|nr:hypothetical protein [Cupriavidus pauculus]